MDQNQELAESLKKHELEHRDLASILLNEKAKTEGITYQVVLFLMSFEAYLNWRKGPHPKWEWVNCEECKVEGKEERQREMESFLEGNPLPVVNPLSDKENIKEFKNLLEDPNAAWKETQVVEHGLNDGAGETRESILSRIRELAARSAAGSGASSTGDGHAQ